MIQRFCFVKLLDPGAPSKSGPLHSRDEVTGRAELAEKLRAELADAGADAVVGIPADDSAQRWDLSIVISAASLDAYHALARLPAMTGVFDDLAERAAVVKAWTFRSVP